MEYLLGGFGFIFGLLIGSFLNVVALRHNTGVSLGGRSKCFSCGHTLSWYDLIPLVSFLILKRRCRYCGCKISGEYFFVELVSGVMFATLFVYLSEYLLGGVVDTLFFLYHIILFALLFVIGLYDIRHTIIPNTFVFSFIVLSVLLPLGVWGGEITVNDLLAGPALAAPFAFLWLISRGRWIGLGDAKLMWGMGWMLGLSAGFSAVLLSFWIGAIYALFLIGGGHLYTLLGGVKKYTIKSELSFAPFLILGTILVFFFGISFGDIQSALTF